jgi:ABC-type uncharacterized transport system substrate-binding protein
MIRKGTCDDARIDGFWRMYLIPTFGRLTTVVFALAVYITTSSSLARAHPHSWIDLRSTVVLDDAGRVTAIEQQWFFDPLYTVFATDGLNTTTDSPTAALMALAKTNLENLRAHDYFTEVRVAGLKAALGTVSEFESELRKGRLWMRFVVPLREPADPTRGKIAFAVFDPTYYAEILHLRDDVIAFRGGPAGSCHGEIVPPNPSTEAILLARAMDRAATPDTSLGKVFAERVKITCP